MNKLVDPLRQAMPSLADSAVPAALTPIAGTVALLQRLHARGHALYFLSNMPEPYAHHLEAAHHFLRLFRRGVFSARVKMIKPEPAIFSHAAESFGTAPALSLFIDDMARNAEAARRSGGLVRGSPQGAPRTALDAAIRRPRCACARRHRGSRACA